MLAAETAPRRRAPRPAARVSLRDRVSGWLSAADARRPPAPVSPSPGDLASREGWADVGTAVVDGHRLVLDGDRRRTASLRTVARVHREGDVLRFERRRAHDWLVQCASAEAAVRLAEAAARSRRANRSGRGRPGASGTAQALPDPA